MELKNAGFTNTEESRKEAMKRMVDGEVFYYGDAKMCFYRRQRRFLAYWLDGPGQSIENSFNFMPEWQVEAGWKEALSLENPRWCKVWDGGRFINVRKVVCYRDGLSCPYEDNDGIKWMNAKPLSDELAALLDAEVGNE